MREAIFITVSIVMNLQKISMYVEYINEETWITE